MKIREEDWNSLQVQIDEIRFKIDDIKFSEMKIQSTFHYFDIIFDKINLLAEKLGCEFKTTDPKPSKLILVEKE